MKIKIKIRRNVTLYSRNTFWWPEANAFLGMRRRIHDSVRRVNIRTKILL